MTAPIQSTQHIQSLYRKYQFITVVFTTITLITAVLAALSGFQLSKLEKRQKELAAVAPPVASAPEPVAQAPEVPDPNLVALDQKINDLESQLTKERKISQKLKVRIQELEKELSIAKSPPPVSKPPAAPLKQSQPKEISPSTKPKVVETVTPVKPSEPTEGTSVVEPTGKEAPTPPSVESLPDVEKNIGIPNPAPTIQNETPPPAPPIHTEPPADLPATQGIETKDVSNTELQESPKEPVEKNVIQPEKSLLEDDANKNEKPEQVTKSLQNQEGGSEPTDQKKDGSQTQ